jgi:mannose-6-phosphate isomerase-like protein (cupin superfamily)
LNKHLGAPHTLVARVWREARLPSHPLERYMRWIFHREGATMTGTNLAEKLSTFSEHWQPRVIGQFNGHDVMVAKVKGEFVWHQHDDTDDFFLVLNGHLTIRMHDGDVALGPGDVFVVPKGVQHCPVAEEEAHILLIEPMGTPNTGNAATAAPRRVI